MRLYLARHAEAGSAPRDDERELTERGIANTAAIYAIAARAIDVPIQQVFCSPLVRAKQTAAIALQTLPCTTQRFQTTALLRPEASIKHLAAELENSESWPLLLVGHQPFMGNFLSWLVDDESLRYSVATSSLYALDLIAFARGGGELRRTWYP